MCNFFPILQPTIAGDSHTRELICTFEAILLEPYHGTDRTGRTRIRRCYMQTHKLTHPPQKSRRQIVKKYVVRVALGACKDIPTQEPFLAHRWYAVVEKDKLDVPANMHISHCWSQSLHRRRSLGMCPQIFVVCWGWAANVQYCAEVCSTRTGLFLRELQDFTGT